MGCAGVGCYRRRSPRANAYPRWGGGRGDSRQDASVLTAGGLVRISQEEFDALFRSLSQESLHLEMRDCYGTEAELPHMAKWAAGEPDDLEWLQDWCDTLRTGVAAGKSFRRALIVSEPLSDY